MIDKKQIAADGAKGAIRGGAIGAAASVVGGLAVSTAPVNVLWFIPIATTTVISMPVVVGAGVVGAVAYGAYSASTSYRRQRANDLLIEDAMKHSQKKLSKSRRNRSSSD